MGVIKKFRIKSFKKKNSIIEFENVSLSYGNRLILDNISFKINESEIFGMLGPNGVGKSTIFNLITGLISPKNGKIKINGEEVNDYPVYLRTKKFKIGYVPQYGGYFGDLTTLDNLKAIGEIVTTNKNLMNDRINYIVTKFELDNIKDIKAKFLSGGQKKKLVIALALLSEPKVLLLDEPSLGIAPKLVNQIFLAIKNINKEKKVTIFLVEQNAKKALELADRAYVLVNGKVTIQGTGQELLKNQDIQAAYLEGGAKS